jgi:phenylacetate-CoA ligase
MDTRSRLDLIASSRATVICCTPTYALRLAEVADEIGFDCRTTDVSRIIVAGEPGGSLPAIRNRIESAWEAQVIDHAGATEVGPWGFADAQRKGLHVAENEFIAEFLPVRSELPNRASNGELAELVLTTLGRFGCPVIRYRTGDLVRPCRDSASSSGFVLLDGGVLGRIDDMVIIRGVNVYPSSVEQILRGFPDVAEYRMIAKKHGVMDSLEIQVEDRQHRPGRIAAELKVRLGLQVAVSDVPLGSLPRFEGKGQRFVDQR